MEKGRAKIKAEMMARLEAQVDELLDWTEEHNEPTLAEIEEVVLRCRQEMGRALAEAVVQNQDKRQEVPGPRCVKCGQEMRLKGNKRRQMLTLVGDVGVERAYYHCPRCKRGLFPPR